MTPTRPHSTSAGARRGALAVAAGVLLTLGYQPFALSAVAWIGLAPLIVALDGNRPRTAFGLGWLTGTVIGLGVSGYWIWRAAIDYFGLAPITAAAFTVGVIQVFVAPFFALFGLLVALLGGTTWRMLLVPAAFVASEYARVAIAGNAWALLGHAQRALPLLQIVDLTGVLGLSFVMALTATAVADVFAPGPGGGGRRARARHAAVAATSVALVLAYGAWRLDHLPVPQGRLRALLVQGDIANAERARPGRVAEAVRRYVELSESVRPVPPLVIWPENAIAVFPAENAALLAPVRDLVARQHVALLAGAPRAGARMGRAAIYNSIYLFTADGSVPIYDKRRLLPFVERFPLRRDDGPYVAGDPVAPVDIGTARAGPLICYEVVDPSLARGLVAGGATLLINLSNDSWFDAGAGPQQHYEIARFRAIENHVSLVRVTNSGISGAFDPGGREIARLPAGIATAEAVDVPLVQGGSFYTRHGDWFAAGCVAVVAIAMVLRRLRQHPQPPAPSAPRPPERAAAQ